MIRTNRYLVNWILDADGSTPIAADNLFAWAAWMETARRSVMDTLIGWPTYSYQYRVSTVFLGVDHAFTPGPPILWETMIFRLRPDDRLRFPRFRFNTRPREWHRPRKRSDHLGFDDWQDRYAMFAAAVHGHIAVETRIYLTLRELRPSTVPPKVRTRYISPAATRLLAHGSH